MSRKSDDFFYGTLSRLFGELLGYVLMALLGVLGLLGIGSYKGAKLLRKALSAPAPGVVIGRERDLSRALVTIPHPERMKHAHVMGATGSGKTTLLVTMAKQDMDSYLDGKARYGVGVIDPKGDFVDRLLGHIPEHRKRDVIVFDPTDTEKPLGFNVLENVPEHLRSLTASQVVATFKKLFGQASWGPRLEHILRYVVLTLLEVPGSTLLDIPTLLLNEDFRQGVLPHVTNFEVADFWEQEYVHYAKGRGQITVVAPILNKIGPWVAYPEVRNIVGQVQSSFDLRKVMDEKKLFLARLPEGLLGEDTRQILGALLITRFQLAATGRANIPERQRAPFLLYVDEFQNFATEASEKIVTEGRSFGLGLVVANQHKGQFRGQPGLFETLHENVAAELFCYKDGKSFRLQYTRLQDRVPPDMEPQMLQLDPLQALPAGAGADPLLEESRTRYGRDRDWVEQDIRRRRRFSIPSSQSPSDSQSPPHTQKDRWSPDDFYDNR